MDGFGHFGWKAQIVSLRDFVLTACASELGLESPDHHQAPSPLHFDARGAAPDLTPGECDALVAYVRSLPAPAQATRPGTRNARAVREGRALFEGIGCAACHVPKLGPIEGIYSDLLLHDMGKALSDGGSYYGNDSDSPEPPNGSEWRTPPLWGIRESCALPPRRAGVDLAPGRGLPRGGSGGRGGAIRHALRGEPREHRHIPLFSRSSARVPVGPAGP